MKHARDPLYHRHRFPRDVISYAVWLYFRFPLSLRMVEEMLAARGIDVSHESVVIGPRNSAGNIPIAFAGAHRLAATSGTWMRL